MKFSVAASLLVGFLSYMERGGLGDAVAAHAYRVPFSGEFEVGLLDLGFAGLGRDTEHLVVVVGVK